MAVHVGSFKFQDIYDWAILETDEGIVSTSACKINFPRFISTSGSLMSLWL